MLGVEVSNKGGGMLGIEVSNKGERHARDRG